MKLERIRSINGGYEESRGIIVFSEHITDQQAEDKAEDQQLFLKRREAQIESFAKKSNNRKKAMTLISFHLPSTRHSFPSYGSLPAQKRPLFASCSCPNTKDQGLYTTISSILLAYAHIYMAREQDKGSLNFEEKFGRRVLVSFVAGSSVSSALPSFGKTKKQNPYDERRLLEQNKRVQRENNAPDDFPSFVREGFSVKVVTSDKYVTRDSGLVLWDVAVGQGDCPKDGQQVTFHYIGYNESGRRIDSTYLQGSPAKVRLGTNALIPGFEEGIRDMKPGGKRRIIVPPELGPPVGPSTFFSSKQFEVFDVELLGIQDCTRRTIGFYSDVVCG